MIDKERPYWRVEIDSLFAKVKAEMHARALLRGKEKGLNKAVYQDVYTGKELFGGDAYDYEHIRSAEAVFNEYKSVLTNEQIALVANCPENVGVTLSSINKSKGKKRMEDWLENNQNIKAHSIDLNLVKSNLKKADEGIIKAVKRLIG